MKIGIFIKNYAVGKKFDKSGVPNKSGAEFHAENHAKLLSKYGDDVYVMTKKTYMFTKGREKVNGIDVCRLHDPIRWLEVMARLLTTHKHTDCFYIVGTPKFAVWAVLMARWLHKPTTLVLTSKSEIFEKNANWRLKLLASCDNYIAISAEIARGLREKAQIAEQKIHILPQGVDTVQRFHPAIVTDKVQLRKKYNFPQDKIIVLFCARVVLNKGIDTMLKAWRLVREKDKDIVLVVVGGGVTTLLDEIKKAGKELDNSITVTGEVDRTDDYYKLADLYLFPSRFEGLPTTLMEAIASGLPCIASKIGGDEDLVNPAQAGILVNPEDYELFADTILNLAHDQALRAYYSKNGREYAVKNLDSTVLLEPLRKILGGKL